MMCAEADERIVNVCVHVCVCALLSSGKIALGITNLEWASWIFAWD